MSWIYQYCTYHQFYHVNIDLRRRIFYSRAYLLYQYREKLARD
nr:MAG TPA: hypothetical protein [Caudoviricetes sp.]DAQ88726.1 MAG TPA: hypothetical protein [Caudoviricetes sp.]